MITIKVTINLEQEKESLEVEISKLESQIEPLQRQLQTARERLSHVNALLPVGVRSSIKSVSNKKINWAEICRQHGFEVGVNSAHRVVRSRDPVLHSSIPHKCEYDNRTYP